MKKYVLPMFVFIASFIYLGCGSSGPGSLGAFVEGTFTRTISNESTRGRDTLIISVLDATGGTYQIVRRVSYVQILDGKELPVVRKQDRWTGVYDPEHHQLIVKSKEKVFSFSKEKGILVTDGGVEYKKEN